MESKPTKAPGVANNTSNSSLQDQEAGLPHSLPPALLDNESQVDLKEIAIQSTDLDLPTCSRGRSQPVTLLSRMSFATLQLEDYENLTSTVAKNKERRVPIIVVSSQANKRPIMIQPSKTLLSPCRNMPQSLYQLALAKLSPVSVSFAKKPENVKDQPSVAQGPKPTIAQDRPIPNELPELSPPDSLTSAPPSYSFVLRQQANARRRPRLMGTFIPSPSFIQPTPPPNYSAAFDIYLDAPVTSQPQRVYTFGFASMPIVCPECGYTGLTTVTSRVTLCTHMCALLLCLFCCWVCVPLPYIMSSCKDVYHYCRNCRNYLGMYSPAHPEAPIPIG